MAGPNSSYDQVSAITQRKIIPKMVDNIFDSNPLLQRAKKNFYEKAEGGSSIDCPLAYAAVSASGWYAGEETLTTTDNDIFTAASYAWKQHYVNISVRRIDEIKNSGMPAIVKFVQAKVQQAEKTLADNLGTGLYNAGTDSKAIGGLRLIVNTSSTVGGISQSSYSWWNGQVDSTTTTLTISAMQSRDNACTIGNDAPTVIATTRAMYNSYYSLLQPQQRFQDESTAKGGFASLMFNQKPVIADSHCPAGYMYFLNEKYLHLWYHPDEDFRFEPFQKPVNQNVRVAKIYWAGAFGSDNIRMQGVMSALTA